jgi:hypothetical protein
MQTTNLDDPRDAMDVRPLTETELAGVNSASVAASFAGGGIADTSSGVPLYQGRHSVVGIGAENIIRL